APSIPFQGTTVFIQPGAIAGAPAQCTSDRTGQAHRPETRHPHARTRIVSLIISQVFPARAIVVGSLAGSHVGSHVGSHGCPARLRWVHSLALNLEAARGHS